MERREKVNACRELARRSGQYISFEPDRWGENMLDSMEIGVAKFLERLPEEVRADYEDSYIEKYKEWLSAMSRCFSQAITGAGGWNASTFRRHEKTNAAEKAALERLDNWVEKVVKRCNRQERLTGWAEVERLQDKIDSLTRSQEMMKAANKVIRNRKLAEVEKVDELVAIGFTEETSIELLYPKYDWQGQGFASYALTNNLAKIKDAEARMKRYAAMAGREDEQWKFCGYELHIDYSDERYRFIFDERPSKEVVAIMKVHGFKWSPSNSAWQRQITPNGNRAMFDIIEKIAVYYGGVTVGTKEKA